MYYVKMKLFISLFIGVTTIVNYCASTRIPSDNYNLSQKLTPLSSDVTKNIIVWLNEQKYEISKRVYSLPLNQELTHYQNKDKLKLNDIKHFEVITVLKLPLQKLLLDLSGKDEVWFQQVSDKRLRKRDTNDTDVNKKRSMSKRKQKKAKVLGRLLRNNVSSKNYEDIQDDYIEDQEDDYFKGANRKKMKWEDFRNEDGASVMELIALNARHKTNMHRA